MADSFTFDETVTFVDGYSLLTGNITRAIEEVHIMFTDVTFLRNMGLRSAKIKAFGLETFTTLAAATTFKSNFVSMEGQTVRIRHDRLTDAVGFDAECMSTDLEGIQTNKTPGFHIVWKAMFKGFPPATPE